MNLSTFTLTCPACGQKQILSYPIIFDALARPEDAERIRQGIYLTAVCPACGEKQDVLLNMLYTDTMHHFMIALQPDPSLPFPMPGNQTMLRSSILRIVRDAEDLSDKLRQLESGIDDRLIEIAKHLFYQKIRASLPAGSIMGMPVFHTAPEGPVISLPMDIKGKGFAMGTDKLTAHRLEELNQLYGPVLAAEEDTGFRLIDLSYAQRFLEFFETYQKAKS